MDYFDEQELNIYFSDVELADANDIFEDEDELDEYDDDFDDEEYKEEDGF